MAVLHDAPRWDLFCRVIDNFGDAGVALRLARNLALRGQRVRLWIDRPEALRGMPDRDDDRLVTQGRLCWLAWDRAERHDFDDPDAGLGERVVELFGCEPPASAIRARGRRSVRPPWINLEYLSAEAYVERSHRLRSPILAGAGQGQARWFFYPGFTPRTGGLLREPGLAASRDAHDAAAWWPSSQGPRPARIGSLFHYPLPAALAAWTDAFARQAGPDWVWIRPGAGDGGGASGGGPAPGAERRWPWLTQAGYDQLLWHGDLNLVRGEDSFVRAQWAARPFLWQAYPQPDGVHEAKVEAFLDRYLDGVASPALGRSVRQAFRALNGYAPAASLADAVAAALHPSAGWPVHARAWAEHLERQPDLATQLIAFAQTLEGRGAG